jgi:hypothetical protein
MAIDLKPSIEDRILVAIYTSIEVFTFVVSKEKGIIAEAMVSNDSLLVGAILLIYKIITLNAVYIPPRVRLLILPIYSSP